MILYNIVQSKNLEAGDTILITGGVMAGQKIDVLGVSLPSEQRRDGMIDFVLEGAKDSKPSQLHPRLAGCYPLEEDSLLLSASYDNEKSLHVTIHEILDEIKQNDHEARSFFLGEKEYTKLAGTNKLHVDAKGASFAGLKVTQLTFMSSILIIEYAPVQKKEG